jgi:hypothetical protein
MHEGAEWKNNRKTEKIDPGRQRWKSKPEEYEIQADIMKSADILGLKNAYALLEENYGQAKKLCEAKL